MKNFSDWFVEKSNNLPWLVIGKGPTFNKIDSIDLSDYQSIALNHAIAHVKANIFHAIDLDVLDGIEEAIDRNSQFILMPLYPNINNESGHQSLDSLIVENLFLRKMNNEGRLLWYNSSLSEKWKQEYPVVSVNYFSADAIISLLTIAGVTKVWSAGLDGGSSYNKSFSCLTEKTLLSNQRKSFNEQFIAIANTLEESGGELIPLGEETVRVFVGTEESQWLATKVLAFSIKLRTSASVDVFPLYSANIEIPLPKDRYNYPRTPFSFQRFLIPELCEFNGKAVYLDSDMQVFTDIRDLANRAMMGNDLLNALDMSDNRRRPQFSVMLMNCERLKWDIKKIIHKLDKGEVTYESLMYDMSIVDNISPMLEKEWNSLEFYEEGKTKLLHYTDMNRQPWLFCNNPYASLWIQELAMAIDYGYIKKSDVKKQVLMGNIRPTLIYQLKTKKYDPKDIPNSILWVDKLFKAPHLQVKFLRRNLVVKWVKGILAMGFMRAFIIKERISS